MHKNSPTIYPLNNALTSGFIMTPNDKENSSSSTDEHRFTFDLILLDLHRSYEPTEPLELPKPTDLSLPILLLTPKEITTFALVVNSHWTHWTYQNVSRTFTYLSISFTFLLPVFCEYFVTSWTIYSYKIKSLP